MTNKNFFGDKKMTTWNVEFSYNISVEADSKEEAEQKAHEIWHEVNPVVDEMNVDISVSNDKKTIVILGHNIEYGYKKDFDEKMGGFAIDHITKLIKNGYKEGEFFTSNYKGDDYCGWWKWVE